MIGVLGDVTPISIKDIFIGRLLAKLLGKKNLLILNEIKKNNGLSLTSVLKLISDKHGYPLSTLKYASKKLFDLGLLKLNKSNPSSRVVTLTPLGYIISDIIEDSENENIIIPEDVIDDAKKSSIILKERLERLLSSVKYFHLNSSLTVLNILLSIFYVEKLCGSLLNEVDIVLSKGHAAPALYVVLNKFGLIPELDSENLIKINSYLHSHASRGTPSVRTSSGSLGQGLSIGNGIALSHKLSGRNKCVYVIIGDGELNEGQIWEAIATSSKYKLDNLIMFIDRNGFQLSGSTEIIKDLEPIPEKLVLFNWRVEYIECNDPSFIIPVVLRIRINRDGRPTAIVVASSNRGDDDGKL